MPSHSTKQQHFFQAVRDVQTGKKKPHEVSTSVRKAASSISEKDAEDFATSTIKELRVKKAVLGVLKDIAEPMYLNEEDGEATTNPIAKEFHVKDDFQQYVRKYMGQPLSPKEMEAINTLKEIKPNKIERTEIWYESSDDFKNSTTTVIKKMKDGNQFSFNAFQKHETATPEEKPEETPMGGLEEPTTPGVPTPPAGAPETEQPEEEKDDIIVTKSILFKDEIKGGSVLAEFLKKLDL